jgi:hypothetical protein
MNVYTKDVFDCETNEDRIEWSLGLEWNGSWYCLVGGMI